MLILDTYLSLHCKKKLWVSWICFHQIFQGVGLGALFPARESLVSDIPAGDGKSLNLYLQCNYHHFYSVCLHIADCSPGRMSETGDKWCRIHTQGTSKKITMLAICILNNLLSTILILSLMSKVPSHQLRIACKWYGLIDLG